MDIKKVTKYTILVFALIIVGILSFYFYTIKKNQQISGDGSSGEKVSIFDSLFGGGLVRDNNNNTSTTTSSQEGVLDEIGKQEILKLRKITPEPISGFTSFDKDGDVIVRYIEKATGHVYETKANSTTLERISNTTIPKVYESIWVSSDSAIIRYLDDDDNIKSFYAEIKESEEENVDGELEGVFLVDNLKNLLSFDNQLFYLLISNDGSRFFVSDPDGENSNHVFYSSLKEWIVQRPKKETLALTTKASYNFGGYLYFLNTSTKKMTKILGGVKGLTTLTSINTENVIFSENLGGKYNLAVLNVGNNKKTKTDFMTFPEKCIWSSNNRDIYCGVPTTLDKGNYPDDWYKGKKSFSDNIWKINIEDNTSEMVVSPNDFLGIEIDLIKPKLSENENYLFFINKKDSSLWSLKLN